MVFFLEEIMAKKCEHCIHDLICTTVQGSNGAQLVICPEKLVSKLHLLLCSLSVVDRLSTILSSVIFQFNL